MGKNVRVSFRDGTMKTFMAQNRSGGSYSIRVEYSSGWVKITDEYECVTSYPSDLIREIEEFGGGR